MDYEEKLQGYYKTLLFIIFIITGTLFVIIGGFIISENIGTILIAFGTVFIITSLAIMGSIINMNQIYFIKPILSKKEKKYE